ncbi:hypothetical protein [Alienimonas sp. DA493]|uniref:hypothetical protein n=1 Tax=Alienimonas sp. DA493 TaxID=3373605 RepID=UPI003754F1E4
MSCPNNSPQHGGTPPDAPDPAAAPGGVPADSPPNAAAPDAVAARSATTSVTVEGLTPAVAVHAAPPEGGNKQLFCATSVLSDGSNVELGRDRIDPGSHAAAQQLSLLFVMAFVNIVGGAVNDQDEAVARVMAALRQAGDAAVLLDAAAGPPGGPAPEGPLALIADRVEPFLGPNDVAYAVVRRPLRDGGDGPQECLRVSGAPFRRFVRGVYFGAARASLPAETVQRVVDTIEAQADFEGEFRPVYVRTAWAEVGGEKAIVIDLGDPQRRAIVITRHGWEIVETSPVAFLRPSGQEPMIEPAPADEADLAPFLDALHLRGDARVLSAAWLCFSLSPSGPYPILFLYGEHGAIKTTRAAAFRRLIDPSGAGLRKPPKNEDDIVIAACNGHVIGFDNLGEMKPWLSDALCRVATGAASGKRKLYSDEDEVLATYENPILTTGIGIYASAADFIDRTLPVHAENVPKALRRRRAEVAKRLDATMPAALSALLNGVAAGLKAEADGRPAPTDLPRMADFAVRVSAAEPALGLAAGSVLKALRSAVGEIDAHVLEGFPAVQLLLEQVARLEAEHEKRNAERVAKGEPEEPFEWRATPTEMFGKVNFDHHRKAHRGNWPSNAQRFSQQLTKVSPILRSMGLEVSRVRGKKREIVISRSAPAA